MTDRKITRDNIVEVVKEALGEYAERVQIRKVPIGIKTDPDIRIKISTVGGRRFAASEYNAIHLRMVNAQCLQGIRLSSDMIPRTRCAMHYDYLVRDNPHLAATPQKKERSKAVGDTIDVALDLLYRTPIMLYSALHLRMYEFADDLDVVDRAMRFITSKTLATTLDVETSYYDAEEETDKIEMVQYVVSSTAQLKVKGSKLGYGLTMLLNRAIDAGPPAPKKKRSSTCVVKRGTAITERERAAAYGERTR